SSTLRGESFASDPVVAGAADPEHPAMSPAIAIVAARTFMIPPKPEREPHARPDSVARMRRATITKVTRAACVGVRINIPRQARSRSAARHQGREDAGEGCPHHAACGSRRSACILSPMRAGEVIDARFEIVGLAGKGGMGTVYRAVDREGGGRVALKVLRD